MENFELVEKLVNTFGVSYEKAKEALEASNWDAVDAAIYLEKAGNADQQPVQNEEPQETKEEAAAEQVSEEPKEKVNTEPKGSTVNYTRNQGSDWKQESRKFMKSVLDFLTLNSFVVKKGSGEVFLDIPIWLMAVLLCAFFWAVILVMGIVFIMGYRFSFSGPQLGKKNFKNTVDHVESMTEEFVDKVKNTVAPDKVESVEQQVKETAESIIENAEPLQDVPAENNEEKDDKETTEPEA